MQRPRNWWAGGCLLGEKAAHLMQPASFKPQRVLWLVLTVLPAIALFGWLLIRLPAARAASVPSQPHTAPSYITLTVNPSIATSGTFINLGISYHNLGMPYTWIDMQPSGVVTYDPPIPAAPCQCTCPGCSALTLRALTTGVVTFTASATGEAYDPECQCFYWAVAETLRPTVLQVTEPAYWVFLPTMRR